MMTRSMVVNIFSPLIVPPQIHSSSSSDHSDLKGSLQIGQGLEDTSGSVGVITKAESNETLRLVS